MRSRGPNSRTSYDEVPYESSSHPQSHPDRLATLGRLFGLAPAPVDRCRVLELGCAMGRNLVPMAFHLPGSEFVGVDSSSRQVTAARDTAAALTLTNVRFEHASILDIDRGWGEFDYLICHGVYSWVPDDVQEKLLAVAGENLAPHGIAYVSYNTYPGWHMREMIRHMMRYHAGRFAEPPERIEQARALLDFLADSVDAHALYGALLQNELRAVGRSQGWYLFHEHLEEVNTPVYFHEFVAQARRHGLRYLAEAEFSAMLTSGFPAETAGTLERISPDIVHAEQYMDFLRNRSFRQTLLCRGEQVPRRRLQAGDLGGFLLASQLIREAAMGEGPPNFRMPDGRRVTAELPLTHAALSVLGEHWPLALDQDTLLSLASERVASAPGGAHPGQQRDAMLQDLLHCYSSGALELRTWPVPCTHQVTATPRVSALAMHQARIGPLVTNQRHEPIMLDPLGRCLVEALDGSRDRVALLSRLSESVERGELQLDLHGWPLTDRLQKERVLAAALDQTLHVFKRGAMLVG